jgi:hypothetical protein
MINGAHVVVTSTNPEADHALLRDVFKLSHVSDGGYIIFGLPSAEMSVHHGDSNNAHQLFLTCADIRTFLAEMAKRKIACSAVQDQGWGLVTEMTLPGGGKLNVYEPRHARPKH